MHQMPSLRVAHAGRDRLAEITVNLRDRIAEAKTNGWTGEEEITVGGVPIEGVVPLRAGDRVRIHYTSATECTISKLVRFD